MTLVWIERIIRWICALAGLAVLGVVLLGLFRGLGRPAGQTSGRIGLLRSPAFYIIFSLLYFTFCGWIWRPLGLHLAQTGRIVFLIGGAVLYLCGLGLVLWGRLTLGKDYFASTTRGALLFAGQQLVTRGPFAWIRHPMYMGYLLTGLGGILLFQTWTMVFFSLHFPALVLRARREEDALSAEFGDEWQEYAARVPAWLPRVSRSRLHPGAAALLESALLFLPAVPAYLWFWPNASGNLAQAGEIVSYVYFALGALLIGRRWPLDQLGVNRRGIGLGLACGAALVLARSMVILGALSTHQPPSLSAGDLIAQASFYFGLVGLVEELLFRGLIYRALDDWLGTPWAIWGSSLGFGLWHVMGQGILIGAATFFYGLIFALIRRRAGGLIGAVFAHGMMDLATFVIISPEGLRQLTEFQPGLAHPFWVLVGLLLFVQVPLYLWKIHPLWADQLPSADCVD